MDLFLLALIQGITEFLPVSSSGHLNIFQSLFNLKPSLDFDIFLHLATLLSVIVFFRQKLKFFFINLPQIILASLPAAIIALVFGSQIEQLFSDISYLPFFFLITSVILFSTKFIKITDKPIGYREALIIGLFQAMAILPGVSRSGSTIFAGLLLGLSPTTAFNFSFALFIPAVLGATLLNLDSLLLFNSTYFFPFIITFFTGVLSLSLLKKILTSKNFWLFSLYTFGLGIWLLLQKTA